jgi:hypothetical protein
VGRHRDRAARPVRGDRGPATATDAARAAAAKITGKQIKDGTIAVKDLSPAARAELAGKTGQPDPPVRPGPSRA